MKLALVLPGGVDRSGELRVIPAFLALIERLARMLPSPLRPLHGQRALALTLPDNIICFCRRSATAGEVG